MILTVTVGSRSGAFGCSGHLQAISAVILFNVFYLQRCNDSMLLLIFKVLRLISANNPLLLA